MEGRRSGGCEHVYPMMLYRMTHEVRECQDVIEAEIGRDGYL